MKKILSLALSCAMILSIMAGCSENKDNDTTTTKAADAAGTDTTGTDDTAVVDDSVPAYTAPASDVEGDITIMMWSGDGSYMEDIGHAGLTPQDLLGQNQAAATATARAFNEIYPNVKVNIYAKSGDPNADGKTWNQYIDDFKAEYGKYPDLYAAMDIPGDIERGLCADISIFANDPVYQSFNPAVMAMMNYNGGQFALPQYLLPWGIFVNKSLANSKNIDIPSPQWTIDEYTEFTAHSEADVYYGAMDCALDILRTGTKDFVYNLAYRNPTDPYVNLNSDAFKALLDYIPQWANNAVNPQNDLGNVSSEFMASGDNWSFNFFKNGKLLTLAGDPWMMGDLAHTAPDHWGRASFDDWDIYPRPATSSMNETVGVVLDPFAVHNYAMDDGNAELSDAEYAKLHIAYEFAKFWVGDTRAIKARAEQQFDDKGVLKTALNDSLPLVTGAAFDEQMEIWYTAPTHQRFGDKDKMPGFQYVLQLWQEGKFADTSDKSYPWRYEFEGSSRPIVYEWENCWNIDVVGATRTDANWVDQMKAHLPDWNTAFNQRWTEKFVSINKALAEYYNR